MSEPGWLERNAWEAVVGLAGFRAAGLGAWAKGWLGGLAPAPGQVERFARHKWRELRRRPATFAREGRVLAALCCLEGDDAQGTTLKALARAFDAHEAMDVVLDWRRLSLEGGARGPAREAAQGRALAIGRTFGADVVVRGEVARISRYVAPP